MDTHIVLDWKHKIKTLVSKLQRNPTFGNSLLWIEGTSSSGCPEEDFSTLSTSVFPPAFGYEAARMVACHLTLQIRSSLPGRGGISLPWRSWCFEQWAKGLKEMLTCGWRHTGKLRTATASSPSQRSTLRPERIQLFYRSICLPDRQDEALGLQKYLTLSLSFIVRFTKILK